MGATIAQNLDLLRAHVAALEARAEAAEQAVAELSLVNTTLRGMYIARLSAYAQLEARMGLVAMCRVQIEGPHDNAQWGYTPC